MNSFILISKNHEKQQEYLDNFVTAHDISPFDVTTISEEGSSIGIEVVRKVQEKIYLTPYKSKEKIIVVKSAHLLTDDAQNALLKLLEEPPNDTYIYLCSKTADTFLPTILSRCTIIKLDQYLPSDPTMENDATKEDVQILMRGTIGQKLVLAEKIAADKEAIQQWVMEITSLLHDFMLESPRETMTSYAAILAKLQEANKMITTTNVSPRTILEHTFLTIQQ